MSIRYGQKIAPLSEKQVASAFAGFNRSFKSKSPTTPYSRPSDYLSIASISSSQERVALLVFISNDDSNFLAFTISGDYSVDWGDGTSGNFSSGAAASKTYDYATYDPSNSTLNSEGFKQAIVIITAQAGQNLTSLNFQTRHPSTNASSHYSQPIAELYISCPNLTTLVLGTASSTTSVYPRSARYVNLINIGNIPALNLSSMHRLQKVDIGKTSTSLTSMSNAFNGCSSLQIVTINSETNTSAVTNMQQMFNACDSLVTVPVFNTVSVTNMVSMFNNCKSLVTVPLFNTASVTNMSNMFVSCFSLVTVPLFNTTNVTSMNGMFTGCASLVTVPLFNTVNVTTMAGMFSTCYSLGEVPLFNTANVTNMTSMFGFCYNLKEVPLFNTNNVTSMGSMFTSCNSLTTIPLFDTSNVTGMNAMFQNCYSLIKVPLLNTSNVTDMANMFTACYSLKEIPLFNTENVTSMGNFVNSCYSLITFPSLNTSKVISMSAFGGCYSLVTIPALNASSVTSSILMSSCFSLASIILTGMRYSVSFSSVAPCKLSKTALETFFQNLGAAATGATRTLTLTDNWGAPTPVSLSGTTTVNSTTITMANTTGLSAGMQVTGVNTPLTTGRSVTFSDSGDTVEFSSHGLSNGDEVSFSSITSTTGIVINTIYFVVNAGANNFQLASSAGGSALTLTTNGSGTILHNSTIVSIVPNTSITMSRPMSGNGTQTLAFRQLGTYKALLKGFAVTG